MRTPRSCQVNAAIERALADGAAAYDERGIMLIRHLDATNVLKTVEPVLEQAIYTIFRGLPDRLARGATLFVSTIDRAGGDVELVWEAREVPQDPTEGRDPTLPLAHGPYGDLLELAISGLEAVCRVRAVHREEADTSAPVSSAVLQLAPHVRRRYSFLVPSLTRERGWSPESARA